MPARIKQVQQQKADAFAAMQATRDQMAASNLSAEDRATLRAKFKSQESEFDEIVADLEGEERMQARERTMQPIIDEDQAAADRARQAASQQSQNGNRQAEGFATMGERMQAVYRAAMPGGNIDRRLMAAATGMNEGVPSEGGFLVGTDQVLSVRQRMYESGQILSRVNQLPISAGSNGIKLMAIDETSRADGSRYGGIVSYWLAEAALKTPSKPSFRPMELSLKKIAAMVYVTDELLQDSTALEAWIMRFLPLELRFKAEDAIVSGTGSGMPLGFLNSGAAVAVNRQSPGAVVYEDIVGMWSRFYAPSRPDAVWLIDQSVEPQLFSMSITVGTGGVPVYLPAGGLSQSPFGTLFGRPVIPVEYLSQLGTKGDVMLADLSQYTLIDKGGVQSAQSMHVRFQYDETAFRFVYRTDGQPEWGTPLTPKNGGPTQSPFVVLN